MLRIQKYLFFTVILVSSLTFIGCGESVQSPQITGKTAYSLSIEQLASRLGLTASKSSKPYYELTNASNRVLIFTYDKGSIYVNGKAIGFAGTITESGGTHYVSELLVPKIRQHLVSSYSAPLVSPKADVSTLRFASGTVVIDPGHGGKDPGGQSVLGYWEKGVNLNIAQKVADYLRNAGVRVVMTRENDSYPELEERADLANRINADLFASIHCDTNGDSTHRGFTVYVARKASWTSKKTGRTIEKTLSNAGIPSKGLRNADYRVLVQTQCPAVLIECGFMSNYDEAALLLDPWYQDKLARAIADGVIASL